MFLEYLLASDQGLFVKRGGSVADDNAENFVLL